MSEAKPKPLPIALTTAERAILERIRVRIGARSAAEAIRRLLEENDDVERLDVSAHHQPTRPPSKAPSATPRPAPPTHAPSFGPVPRKPGTLLKR